MRCATVTGTSFGRDAALDRLDHELGGVELLLAQDELRQDGRCVRRGSRWSSRVTLVRVISETIRLKKTIPHLAGEVVGDRRRPSTREPWATSTSPSRHRLDQALHLRGQVLPVGVEGDDDRRARFGHQPVAGAQRRAAAAVDHVAGDHGAVLGGDARRCRRASRRRRPALRSASRRPRPGSDPSTWPMLSASL